MAQSAISTGEYGNKNDDFLGQIVDASHWSAVNLLKNQITETAWLPLWARGIEGDLQLKPLGVRDDKLLEILQRRYNFLPRVINTISNQKHVRSAGTCVEEDKRASRHYPVEAGPLYLLMLELCKDEVPEND